MKNFFVYILKCNDGSYYTGHTDDIEKRIAEHNNGFIDGYTAERLPVEIIFLQEFATRDEAFNAERQIKGWSRKKKQLLINKEWNLLSTPPSKIHHRTHPSTSSGRADGELLHPEFIEGSGRAEVE